MVIKSDLIIKGAIAFVLVFVLGKVLTDVIRGLLGGVSDRFIYGKKEGNQDIDIVINRKINEMRLTQGSAPQVSSGEKSPSIASKNDSDKNSQSKLTPLQIYQQAFTCAVKENNEQKIKEYKLALELFDHLQWGDGKHYKIIEAMSKQNYQLPISLQDISINFKEMNAKNIFASFDLSSPLGHTALNSFIGHKSAFDQVIKKICEGEEINNSIFKMSTLNSIPAHPTAFLLTFYLLSKRNASPDNIDFKSEIDCFLAPELIRKKLQQQEKRFPLNQFLPIITTDYKNLKSTMEIQDHIVSLAKFLNYLISYPELNKDNQDVARVILETNQKDDFIQIKKKYKRLVASRHPDKFQSYNFPKEIIGIINENFIKIQTSYNMLKKEMGEDE